MARARPKALIIAGAITVTVCSLCPVVLRLLPPLHPLSSQLLLRLREALAFLTFTTAIAIGILTSQRKDKAQDNLQYKHFLEYHTIAGSIFGEPSYGEADASAHNGKHGLLQSAQEEESSKDNLHVEYATEFVSHNSFAAADAASPKSMLETCIKACLVQKAKATREDSTLVTGQNEQQSLDGSSRDLHDSVNHEPAVKSLDASSPAPLLSGLKDTQSGFARKKPVKRVSFSLAPLPPRDAAGDQSLRRSKTEPAEKSRDLSASNPGDLTGQADAFIAKFKEQLRMQNLGSIPKYHRHA